ncbi:hypothetical protein CFB43_13305 [Burkholderia sp. AU15512]|nr:hypothetical protein CFB43_13305 [Burkholderia sp. AU15512]
MPTSRKTSVASAEVNDFADGRATLTNMRPNRADDSSGRVDLASVQVKLDRLPGSPILGQPMQAKVLIHPMVLDTYTLLTHQTYNG